MTVDIFVGQCFLLPQHSNAPKGVHLTTLNFKIVPQIGAHTFATYTAWMGTGWKNDNCVGQKQEVTQEPNVFASKRSSKGCCPCEHTCDSYW